MKESIYNKFFNKDEVILAYNARTNALAEICVEDYQIFLKWKENKIDQLPENLESELLYGGFVVPKEINEEDLIKNSIMASRYSTKCLNLTIAPTSNCNFRCPYCYEKDVLKVQRMSDITANNILKMIKDRIKHLETVNITWYGGEPLLELDRILSLSQQIIKICEENNTEYYASMVTNGYFLTCECLERLIEVKVKNIQITLDGTQEYHDNRRYRVGKKPTFGRIIQNLKSLKKIEDSSGFPVIGIRMNVDKNNFKSLYELDKYLLDEGIQNYATFYIAAVFDPNDYSHEYTYTPEEFSVINKEFQKKKKINSLNDYYPNLAGNHCMCDSLYGYVIDSDGGIYKCWEEMGKDNCKVGIISEYQKISYNPRYYSYLLSDILKKQRCLNCPVLPICMGGGCPERIIQHNYQPDCKSMISSIYENIEKSYEIMKKDSMA